MEPFRCGEARDFSDEPTSWSGFVHHVRGKTLRSRGPRTCGLFPGRRTFMDWRCYSRRPLTLSGLVRLPSANAPRRRLPVLQPPGPADARSVPLFERRSTSSNAGHVPAADLLAHGKALPRPERWRATAFPQFRIWMGPAEYSRRGFRRWRFRDLSKRGSRESATRLTRNRLWERGKSSATAPLRSGLTGRRVNRDFEETTSPPA